MKAVAFLQHALDVVVAHVRMPDRDVEFATRGYDPRPWRHATCG